VEGVQVWGVVLELMEAVMLVLLGQQIQAEVVAERKLGEQV
jgi:hypothetical protein